MKVIFKFLAVVAMALSMASCKPNAEMETVVNEDGSCFRKINVLTTEHFRRYEGWDKVMHPPLETVKSGQLELTAGDSIMEASMGRNFASVGDMCRAWSKFENKKWAIQSAGTFKTTFKWFYTYYTFRERFSFPDGLVKKPAEQWLTPEEMQYWSTGGADILGDSFGDEAYTRLLVLNEKIRRWRAENVVDLFLEVFEKHWDLIDNPPVTLDEFNMMKGVVYYDIDEYKIGTMDLDTHLDKFFETDAFSKACRDTTKPFFNELAVISSRLEAMCSRSYICSLRMPGNIVDSNTGKIEDGVLYYKLSADNLLDHYDVIAISRKANVWAFVVSILVLIAAVASYFIKVRK
ncbi:MAG: hypothetical protein MJZ66_08015 [Bacteroidales bacterium]|nr:hypothetical protein [Bacteroidales bacterium]